VKRFDRTEIARVHVEDFNQIYNQYPASKYDNVSYGNMLRDIWRILGERDAREFVRRLVFSIGIGNADMHLKNWSVIYRDGKTPALAPAYDFLSTIVYLEDDKLALSMSRTKRWGDITYDLLERFARKAEVPRGIVLASARQMVSDMRDAWPQMSDVARLPAAALGKIERHMDSIPIFTESKMYGLTPTRATPARDQIG
jgi:serine/threonine-protein kinase HipA